jgi:hypothetical protein
MTGRMSMTARMTMTMTMTNNLVGPQEPGFHQKCPSERSTNKNWESLDASQW